MKHRTIILPLILIIVIFVLTACGFSQPGDKSPVSGGSAAVQPAIYSAQPSETPVSTIWDVSKISCEGKPLYAWRTEGAFTWHFSYPGYDLVSTFPQTEAKYSVPSDSECGWLSVGLGEIMPDVPTEGGHAQWSGSCRTTTAGSTKTILQQIDIRVSGWEQKTTKFGTFHALRLKSINQYADSTTPGVLEVDDWYVCGYGRVYSESTDSRNDTKYVDELLSFTPQTTNEAHVRYILLDAHLVNTIESYRMKVNDEETAEALRRWDAGIRVTNPDMFERKLVNGLLVISYVGTENPVKGMDVQLTSDPQQ